MDIKENKKSLERLSDSEAKRLVRLQIWAALIYKKKVTQIVIDCFLESEGFANLHALAQEIEYLKNKR